MTARSSPLIREQRHGRNSLASVVAKPVSATPGCPICSASASDVEDICRRIMDMLRGVTSKTPEDLDEEAVIVARTFVRYRLHAPGRWCWALVEAGGKTSPPPFLPALKFGGDRRPNISASRRTKRPIIIDGNTGFAATQSPKTSRSTRRQSHSSSGNPASSGWAIPVT